jgi:membrane protease YdiL (CAAX protease family)
MAHGIYMTWQAVAGISGILLLTWVARVKVEHKPWSGMALPRLQLAKLLLGCAAGLVGILILALIEGACGWVRVAEVQTVWTALPLGLVISIGVGVTEELTVRGYILQTLGEALPLWLAALLSSIVFAVLHFMLAGFNGLFVASDILMALSFIALRFATGSLWFPIGFHAMWDWAQVFFIGLANSALPAGHDPALIRVQQSGPVLWVGGAETPEGGLLVLAMAIVSLAALCIQLSGKGILPRAKCPLSLTGSLECGPP